MTDPDLFELYRQVLEDKIQQRVRELGNSSYLNYPLLVQLETLALCQAACTICPYPQLERKGTRMDDGLIDKVLSDLKDIPAEHRFFFAPFKVNEPFLDTRLLPLLRRLEHELPQAKIQLISNAGPLNEKLLNQLAKLQNIHSLSLSVHEYRPEAYQQLMGIPFERTLSRLRLIHRFKEQGRLNFTVSLTRVADKSAADQAFVSWVLQHFPLFSTGYFPRGEWLRQVPELAPLLQVSDISCVRWFELSIMANGKVAFCCMDGQGEWPLGDVRTQHLLEIYNQPAYRRLRAQAPGRHSLEPCRQCTYLTYM